MYSWKLSSKFRFGRSKDKDEKHHKHMDEVDIDGNDNRSSVDRKATIVPGSATVVQSRASTDTRTTSDDTGHSVHSSGFKGTITEGSMSTDISGEDISMTNGRDRDSTEVQSKSNNNSSNFKQQQQQLLAQQQQIQYQQQQSQQQPVENENTHSSNGILTVKVYSGDSFKLPLPITYNEQVLSKLLSSCLLYTSRCV